MALAAGDAGLHVIGFSLGAMTAILAAAKRPDAVKLLTFISPAAPLELGDYLPEMAGRAVFEMAARNKMAFKILTQAQAIGVKLSPHRVAKMMFQQSIEAEQNLLCQPDFKSNFIHGLQESFGSHRHNYSRVACAYVQPWAERLKDVKCFVALHHGSDDNWAPVVMSHALEAAFETDVMVNIYGNLGHYTTLHHVAKSTF